MSPLSLYVAGSSRDLHRVEAAMVLGRAVGFAIAYDWVAEIRAAGGVANEGLSLEVARRVGRRCREAAWQADVMWVLLDEAWRSPGAHVELGVRLAICGERGLYLTGLDYEASIHYAEGVYAGPSDGDVYPHLLGQVMARRTA